MRSLSANVILALLLVFAQQQGEVHLASHAAIHLLDGAHDKTHNTTDDTLCEKCSLYAALGCSPPAAALPIPAFEPASTIYAEIQPVSIERYLLTAYQSRAPPSFA